MLTEGSIPSFFFVSDGAERRSCISSRSGRATLLQCGKQIIEIKKRIKRK
jgi:hypothetical protein